MHRSKDFQKVAVPKYLDNGHVKVARLSALRSGNLYHKEINLILIFVRNCVEPRN